MKTFIIALSIFFPCAVFAQSMHLPGAAIPHSKHDSAIIKSRFESLSNPNMLEATGQNGNATTKGQQSGTVVAPIKYDATVLSTNFTVPLMRINLLSGAAANATHTKVSTSYFNSVGAGVNSGWGELDQTLDANNNTASADFHTHFGFQAGVIFAANTASSSTTTTSAAST